MAGIPLRLYIQEIEKHIESGRNDEAIAHCLYILESYPKYIDIHRLLGKALLESQRYSDATDNFSRVLSSIPDDFVAHVSMSIIREDEGNLNEAIWHMERAFEIQPANSAIQNELRRIYGRRDGVEPPNIRLTRGALARMYYKERLYPQAIAEASTALAEDSNRLDLQVLLIEIYTKTGQRTEATDTANSVLKKISYCLIANQVMAASLSDAEQNKEAQIFRQRLNELDPYTIFTGTSYPNTSRVPDQAITLEKLEWKPEPMIGKVEGQLARTVSPGVEPDKLSPVKEEPSPEWLYGVSTEKPEEMTTEDMQQSLPASSLESPPEGAELITPDQEVPDWLLESEVALTKVLPSEEEIASTDAFSIETQVPPPVQPPEEIPAWLLEEELPTDTVIHEEVVPEKSVEEIPDWLNETGVASTGDIPEWLLEVESPPTDIPLSDTQPTHVVSSEQVVVSPPETIELSTDVVTAGVFAQESASTEDSNGIFPWLEGMAATKDKEKVSGLILQESSEIPHEEDQQTREEEALSEEEREYKETGTPIPESAIPVLETEPTVALTENEAAFAWLEGLAVKQGAKEALLLKPEERLENPPEWIQRTIEEKTPAKTEAEIVDRAISAVTVEGVEETKLEKPKAGITEEAPGMTVSSKESTPPAEQELLVPETSTPIELETIAEVELETTITPEKVEIVGKIPAFPIEEPIFITKEGEVTVGLEEAHNLLNQGNLEQALDKYARLIQSGQALSQIIQDLENISNRYPQEIQVWQKLGDAYLRSDQVQQALQAYVEAERLL